MSKYPVTQAQYESIIGKNPSHFKGSQRPVESVSWDDAQAFCQKLANQTNKAYNLMNLGYLKIAIESEKELNRSIKVKVLMAKQLSTSY